MRRQVDCGITEDNHRLSPSFNLEQILAYLDPRDIDIQLVESDRDSYGGWLLQLRVRWRHADPEDTDPINRGVLFIVRLVSVNGLTD